MRPICPYCGNLSEKVLGSRLYPGRQELRAKSFWACLPCGAWVGCYAGGDRPLGRLANKELRVAKMTAHAVFDPLWKDGSMTRTQAYLWLAKRMDLPAHKCHIGMFDLDQCRKVVEVVTKEELNETHASRNR